MQLLNVRWRSISSALQHLVSFNVFQILFKPIFLWNCLETVAQRWIWVVLYIHCIIFPKQLKLISAVLLVWLFLDIVFARALSKSNPCWTLGEFDSALSLLRNPVTSW